MDFNKKLIDKMQELSVNIDLKKASIFKHYMDLLLEWNNKINLTTIIEEDDIILKHFVDSLTINHYINDNDNVIDIGTGAGFPGIPLKIVKDNIEITLMDSLNKRIIFLNEVINFLDLKNIKAIHSRAEELGQNILYRECFNVAVSRAVSNLSTLVEYMLPFVKVGGKCICMKGPNIQDEVRMAQKPIKILGGKLISIDNLKLPKSNYERNIVIIEKVTSTNKKYPRKSGIPSKNPIE